MSQFCLKILSLRYNVNRVVPSFQHIDERIQIYLTRSFYLNPIKNGGLSKSILPVTVTIQLTNFPIPKLRLSAQITLIYFLTKIKPGLKGTPSIFQHVCCDPLT